MRLKETRKWQQQYHPPPPPKKKKKQSKIQAYFDCLEVPIWWFQSDWKRLKMIDDSSNYIIPKTNCESILQQLGHPHLSIHLGLSAARSTPTGTITVWHIRYLKYKQYKTCMGTFELPSTFGQHVLITWIHHPSIGYVDAPLREDRFVGICPLFCPIYR